MLCFVFAALIVLLDQFIKRWIVLTLELRETGPTLIPGIIRLTRWENDGAMLNILAGQQWLLAGIAFIAAFVLIMILLRYNEGFWGTLGLASVLGGTVGNLTDRVFNEGYVIDMFQTTFIRFPIFNIADIFITLGFITFCIHFIVLTFKAEDDERESTAYDPDDGEEEYYEEEYEQPAEPVTYANVNVQIESDIDYFATLNTAPAEQSSPEPVAYRQPVAEPAHYEPDPLLAETISSALGSLDTLESALEEIDEYDMNDLLREYGFEEDKN